MTAEIQAWKANRGSGGTNDVAKRVHCLLALMLDHRLEEIQVMIKLPTKKGEKQRMQRYVKFIFGFFCDLPLILSEW